MLRRAFRHYGLIIGGTIFGLMVLMALMAPPISPHDPYYQDLLARVQVPVWFEAGAEPPAGH